jgi:hypothetical protein
MEHMPGLWSLSSHMVLPPLSPQPSFFTFPGWVLSHLTLALSCHYCGPLVEVVTWLHYTGRSVSILVFHTWQASGSMWATLESQLFSVIVHAVSDSVGTFCLLLIQVQRVSWHRSCSSLEVTSLLGRGEWLLLSPACAPHFILDWALPVMW